MLAITSENKRNAYLAGEHAFQMEQISADAWHLYERLVLHAGEHGCCWHKVETLAAEFRVSVRELSRRLRELVKAMLVRRKRRSGESALTYITAYDDELPWQRSFFADDVSDPDLPSVSDRIKEENPDRNTIGGGSDLTPAMAPDTEEPEPPAPSSARPPSPVEVELRSVGVADATIVELTPTPLDRVRRAIEDARRARGVRSIAGFVVYLLRNNIALEKEHSREQVNTPRNGQSRRDHTPVSADRIPPWADVGPCRDQYGQPVNATAAAAPPDRRTPGAVRTGRPPWLDAPSGGAAGVPPLRGAQATP